MRRIGFAVGDMTCVTLPETGSGATGFAFIVAERPPDAALVHFARQPDLPADSTLLRPRTTRRTVDAQL